MEESPSFAGSSRIRRIREMGFDPDFLTVEEQQELLDLHARLAAVEEVAYHGGVRVPDEISRRRWRLSAARSP